MSRILCVYFPNWPIQRRTAATAAIVKDSRPLVLTASAPRWGRRVVACSADACQKGIRIGMPFAEAKSLARSPVSNRKVSHCHSSFSVRHDGSVRFEWHNPQADRMALMEIAQWCEKFSPVVGLEAGEQPSSLLFEVTGLAALFGDEEALARQVVVSCQQRGYWVRVSIADCIGAAWAVAHFNAPQKTVISDNITIVPSGMDHARQVLAFLPLTALRLADETVELLQDLGITRIGQVLQLPRASLTARFGDNLIKRLDQACGLLPEIVVAHRAPPRFYAQWSLEYPTHSRGVIEHVLLQLVEQVVSQLNAQGLGAVELECQLHACPTRGVPTSLLRIALFQPTCSVSHLADLIPLQLERMSLPGLITEISVEAITTAPLQVRQRKLFADYDSQDRNQLGVLANRLGSRLGEKRVMRVRLRAEVQPERASFYSPVTSRGKRSSNAIDLDTMIFRPLKLFASPLRLHVNAASPDTLPVRFCYENRQYQVGRYWGPERIETGWWRGRSVRRDYYRVETQTGQRFWFYRQLDNGQWFLQGAFD